MKLRDIVASRSAGDKRGIRLGRHLSPRAPNLNSMVEMLVAAGVGAIIVIGLVALLRRPREADPRLDRVLTEIAAVRGSSESVDRRVDELRRSVGERVSAVETRLVEGQKDVADTLGAVHEKIGRVFQASERIERLAGDMTRLEDLLKPPKIRGNLGE